MLLAIWQFEALVSIDQITFDSMENFATEGRMDQNVSGSKKKKSTINKIRQFLIQIIDSKSWFKRECNLKLVLTFLTSFLRIKYSFLKEPSKRQPRALQTHKIQCQGYFSCTNNPHGSTNLVIYSGLISYIYHSWTKYDIVWWSVYARYFSTRWPSPREMWVIARSVYLLFVSTAWP